MRRALILAAVSKGENDLVVFVDLPFLISESFFDITSMTVLESAEALL